MSLIKVQYECVFLGFGLGMLCASGVFLWWLSVLTPRSGIPTVITVPRYVREAEEVASAAMRQQT